MSKETLEEYINEVTKNFDDEMSVKFTSGGIKLGAKWQAERMYSEEDMISFATWLSNLSFNLQHFNENGLKPFNELLPLWQEQYKKK